jgi:hypothetical protein
MAHRFSPAHTLFFHDHELLKNYFYKGRGRGKGKERIRRGRKEGIIETICDPQSLTLLLSGQLQIKFATPE